MSEVLRIVHFRKERLQRLFLFCFFLLIIAHGSLTTYLPAIPINVGFIILMAFLIYMRYKEKRDYFDMAMILYVLSHFTALLARGGLTPILGTILAAFLYFNRHNLAETNWKNNFLKYSIYSFVGLNLLGYIFKPTSDLGEVITGALAFIGFIFIFWISYGIRLTIPRLGFLVKIMIVMTIYESFIALNTYLGLVKTGFIIFFPATSRFGSPFAEASFNHSELFGEWSLLSFFFFISFLGAKRLHFNVKRSHLLIGICFAMLNVFLSGSRSIFALLIGGSALIYLASMSVYATKIEFGRMTKYIIYGVSFLLILWQPLNLGYVIDRFSADSEMAAPIEVENISLRSIITGEGTPREGAFIYFFNRYAEETMTWLGHGYGTVTYNRKAWFGNLDTKRADYHSLYLSVIITYGWIGAIIYIGLFIYTIWRLFYCLRLVKRTTYFSQYFYPLLGFTMMLTFLLINEYKISLLRIPTYHMITWIWLGWANALCSTVKREIYESTVAGTLSTRND